VLIPDVVTDNLVAILTTFVFVARFAKLPRFQVVADSRDTDECVTTGAAEDVWEYRFLAVVVRLEDICSLPREYNEERPKRSLGGLPPAAYARQLADKALTVPGTL